MRFGLCIRISARILNKMKQEVFMSIFLIVLGTIFIAEMGDKTQLLLVAMANKYRISQILAGTWLATLLLNLLAVFVGAALSQYLDMRIIKVIAAAAFFWFAHSALAGDDDDEGQKTARNRFGPVLAIFSSFFIGELGDKTQLSAITLAASYTQQNPANAAAVFAGCTLGLILADFIGLITGLFLKSKMPTGILNKISFLIFAAFGAFSAWEASALIFSPEIYARLFSMLITLLFLLICGHSLVKRRS